MGQGVANRPTKPWARHPDDSPPIPNISHLSCQVDDAAPEELFANDGTVQSAQVVLERDTARSKGFGFVEMGGETGAQAAIDARNDFDTTAAACPFPRPSLARAVGGSVAAAAVSALES